MISVLKEEGTQTPTEGRLGEDTEGSVHLQAKERGTRRNQICQHILDFQPPEPGDDKCLLLKPTGWGICSSS